MRLGVESVCSGVDDVAVYSKGRILSEVETKRVRKMVSVKMIP